MKRALIAGTRICQLVDIGQEFDVAPPLAWVDVPDDTRVDRDTYENGKVVKWSPPAPTWEDIRMQRVPLLAEADIAVNKRLDTGKDCKAWSKYRQALRDVTDQADPAKVKWPKKPKAA